MTEGPVGRAILLFALPIMGSGLLQTLYLVADSLIIGNYIGPTALGAVGLTGSLLWLLLTFCTGVGGGVGIVLAQLCGAEREEDVRTCIGASYALGGIVAAALTLPAMLFAAPLLARLLATPPEMLGESARYLRIFAAGTIFQMLYNVTYGVLRAHGDSKGALLCLGISSVLNVALDLLFVGAFSWGVGGAAFASVLAQAASAAAAVRYLAHRFPEHRLRIAFGAAERRMAGTVLRIATPLILQSAVLALGFTALQRLVNGFGAASVEAYTVSARIEHLAHIPGMGLNAALAAFVGQNVGAKNLGRARAGYRTTLRMGTALIVFISLAVALAADPLLGMFNIAGEAFSRAREQLLVLMASMCVVGVAGITSGFLQGAGDVRTPALGMALNLGVHIAAAYAMARTPIGYRSIYLAYPIAVLAGCAVVLARYRGGGWRDASLV